MDLLTLALGVLAVGALYGLDRVAVTVVKPVPRPADPIAPRPGVSQEDVRIPSGDHILTGRLLRPDHAVEHALVLLAHGWGASHGALLDLAHPLVAAGHPVLLFDIRGHGGNRAVPYVTVRHFRDDIEAVVAWAADRHPDRRRVLVGHSMGGAGAVLAAARGAPVDGLVLLATPADVLEVTARYLDSKGLPGGLLVVALRPFWWPRVGGTFGPLAPERRIGEVAAPILILQPEDDRRVPRDHPRRLARAAGMDFELVQGTGHTDILEHPELHRRVLRFLEDLVP